MMAPRCYRLQTVFGPSTRGGVCWKTLCGFSWILRNSRKFTFFRIWGLNPPFWLLWPHTFVLLTFRRFSAPPLPRLPPYPARLPPSSLYTPAPTPIYQYIAPTRCMCEVVGKEDVGYNEHFHTSCFLHLLHYGILIFRFHVFVLWVCN